jgi:hypothetical protein
VDEREDSGFWSFEFDGGSLSVFFFGGWNETSVGFVMCVLMLFILFFGVSFFLGVM